MPESSDVLVISLVDYDQVFDSADIRALGDVLSLHGIPVKYLVPRLLRLS